MSLPLRAVAFLVVVSLSAVAQPPRKVDFQSAGKPLPVQPVDPKIAAALHDISSTEIRKTVEAMVSFNNRNTAGGDDKTLPPSQGVRAAAAWIHARFQAISDACGGCLEVHEDEFTQPAQTTANPRIKKPTTLINVYAVMKGIDPAQSSRRILVTGHYDSFFLRDMQNVTDPAPGANDDASGTAVSLESARVLSKLRLPATLVFAAVAGEEQGLLGAAHLAKVAKSEGWELEGVLNNDIVGGDTTPADLANEDKHRVRIFSEGISLAATPQITQRILTAGEESDSPSRQLARAVTDVARTYTEKPLAKAAATALHPVLIFRLDRYLRGGDHSAFNREGFAGIRFTEWRENFDHQHQFVRVENGTQFGDLIQFDDFDYIARVARINAAILATLAAAPASPANVTMLTRNLNNDSVLTWAAPASMQPGIAYEVLWRETNAADWQYSAPTAKFEQKLEGDTYTVTVPVSKDNVLFGIRACDGKGHCSPAAAPLPR